MACRYCNDKNKVIRTLAWAVYLAPLAYSAYVVLKDIGAFEKVQPYLDSAKETAQDAFETAKETAQDLYDKVKGDEKIADAVETVKDVVTDTAEDIKDGNA